MEQSVGKKKHFDFESTSQEDQIKQWHVDGYDKIKPYAFSIHGCIDVHSRRILWLSIVPLNNNPEVVGKLYLDYVKSVGGCPKKVVGNRGTENSYIAAFQRYFRRNSIDESTGENSFVYDKSMSNQQIETQWSQLRKSCTGWWMDHYIHSL